MKTIVIIGGGSGTFNMITGLRVFPTNNIVIVSTADNGGSTGTLRKEFGVMPPGDIRQCLVGLSYTVPALCDLFNYRFDKGGLNGHTVGNIILAGLEKVKGSPDGAVAEAARLLNVRGEVLFVSTQPTTLSAHLADGNTIVGEHEIDEPSHKKRSPIKSLTLSPAEASPRVIDAIGRADAIILGPGDLFTSTFPNLLVPGIAEAVRNSQAKKILITNIMTKFGQTDGFTASRFLSVTNEYLGAGKGGKVIDAVIVNTKIPPREILKRYEKEKAVFVKPDIKKMGRGKTTIIAKPLISNDSVKKVKGDSLKRSLIRHDSTKVASIIWQLLQ